MFDKIKCIKIVLDMENHFTIGKIYYIEDLLGDEIYIVKNDWGDKWLVRRDAFEKIENSLEISW